MTKGRKGTTRKAVAKKLKLKKESLKDLDAKRSAKGVKGGLRRGGNETKILGTCTFVQACT